MVGTHSIYFLNSRCHWSMVGIHIILTSQTIDSTVLFISCTINYNKVQDCAKLHIQQGVVSFGMKCLDMCVIT